MNLSLHMKTTMNKHRLFKNHTTDSEWYHCAHVNSIKVPFLIQTWKLIYSLKLHTIWDHKAGLWKAWSLTGEWLEKLSTLHSTMEVGWKTPDHHNVFQLVRDKSHHVGVDRTLWLLHSHQPREVLHSQGNSAWQACTVFWSLITVYMVLIFTSYRVQMDKGNTHTNVIS